MIRDDLFAELARRGWTRDGVDAAIVHVFHQNDRALYIVDACDGHRWVMALHVVGCHHPDAEVRETIEDVEMLGVGPRPAREPPA